MTTFCLEHGISRRTFYEIRKRVALEGPAAVLEPKSRRPRHSPNALREMTVQDALRVRAALKQSGLDHGPISVHDRMRSLEIVPVPSTAALALIFRAAGVARLEPKKKPRAAYRRFVYPAPNACWQLDATEYVLTGGRICVIFQLIDDHSRLAIASHAAAAETSADEIAVLKKGIAAHGVPQRQGIQFKSLTEPFDTTDHGAELFFYIVAAFAQIQRRQISEKTRAGLAAAKARGRLGGRPTVMDPNRVELAKQMRVERKSFDDVAALLRVGASSVKRALRDPSVSGPGG